MLIFTLNKSWAENPDIETFFAIYKLILKNQKKLFDDEYFKGQIPSPNEVLDLIKSHIPYFWLFLDKNKYKTLGVCWFYDIVPAKTYIHTVTAAVCFDKKALGPKALYAAKTLVNHSFWGLNIYKIKAECYFDTPYIKNFLTKLGFSREATLKNETIVDFKPKNIEIWSIFNPNLL